MAKKDDDILEEARSRFSAAITSETFDRGLAENDIEFEAGQQWPEELRREREYHPDGPRPCLVVNMVRKHANALINDMRRSRPSVRVLPVDDYADPETAKVLNGLLRHIQVTSDASVAYDCAAESQVISGLGYWRILPVEIDDYTGEQELRIVPIRNRFAVYMDPMAQHPAGADAKWCFVAEEMRVDEFMRQYPKARKLDWTDSGQGDDRDLWRPSDDTIRVAEYFRIVEERTNILLLDDGEEIEEEVYWSHNSGNAMRPQIVATRTKTVKRCEWYKLSGAEILETTTLPTRYVPVVRVVGEERYYDGKREFRGIVRDMRDPQSMYNYTVSVNVEYLALHPRAPYIGPVEAFEGLEQFWEDANRSSRAYLPYNQYSDQDERLDKPERAAPLSQSTALVSSMMQFAEDLRQVSGQSAAGFGEPSNEQSGRAIFARRQAQDSNTFHFIDQLGVSIKHTGKILLDMIPRIYDTRRVVRILGEDEMPSFAVFDPESTRSMLEAQDAAGRIQRIYNPSIGQYDVIVEIGQSYATRAQEGADRLSDIIQARPDLLPVVGDLLFKFMDVPGSDELAERMKALMPPELRELENAKRDGAAAVQAQVAQMQEAMQAQIEPIIAELQAALEQASVENDELEQKLQEAELQIQNKVAEYELKARELEIKAFEVQSESYSKQQDAEAEVAVALINRQPEREENEAEKRPANGESAAVMGMMQMIMERLSQADTASAIQDVAQQVSALADRLEATEAERERMRSLAAGVLMGSVSEEDAAKVLMTH